MVVTKSTYSSNKSHLIAISRFADIKISNDIVAQSESVLYGGIIAF